MRLNDDLSSEILSLEKKYWNAMRERDLKTAMDLTDFPCLVAGANGVFSVDRDEFQEIFASNQGAMSEFRFEEDNAEIHQVGPDTAVIAYKVHSTVLKDKESKTIDAVDASTWIRRDNKWLCAMHTETVLSP